MPGAESYRAHNRARMAERYRERRAAGLCTQCGKRSERTYCSQCADLRKTRYQHRINDASSLRRQIRRDALLCVDCGKPSRKYRCQGCSPTKKGGCLSYIDESRVEGSDQWLVMAQLAHQQLSVPDVVDLLDCKRSKAMSVLYALRSFGCAQHAGGGMWELAPRAGMSLQT